MSTDTQETKNIARELAATDPEFAAARPDPAVSRAIEAAGTRFPQVTEAVLEGYADRPALAQRAYELVQDPQTGRTSAKLLPWFDQAHLRRVGRPRRRAVPRAGRRTDRQPVTGSAYSASPASTTPPSTSRWASSGAVSVPLQTSAAITQLQPIVAETEPTVFAASVDYLADAVDVILAAAEAGHLPGRLVVFDYRDELDDNREALQSAQQRLADLELTVETLNDVRERGAALPAVGARPARMTRKTWPTRWPC